jgi:hypothetical protein
MMRREMGRVYGEGAAMLRPYDATTAGTPPASS